MSQKRMFDKAIIQTDRFMDLSMSSKALYFLLGMEADDEGFVSYKMVMRIHGGNEDDIKVLVAKGFLIMFESGVVVVTDWNKNNWLDSRRIKPTEYRKEKKLVVLTQDKEYVLSNCLASIEEYRVEESSIEENTVAEKLPEGIDLEYWGKWETHRKEIRKKLTPSTKKSQLNFLVANLKDHKEIINQSIQNGWTGLFEVKKNYKPNNTIQSTTNKYDKYN